VAYPHGELPTSRFLRCIPRQVDPALRLVCFPHVGGAASFFRSWVSWLPEKVELIAACYPGREDQIAESPATAMAELVAPSVRACLSLSDAPLALFGHSMGAVVAYEVAVHLQHDHGCAGGLVSGCGSWRSRAAATTTRSV